MRRVNQKQLIRMLKELDEELYPYWSMNLVTVGSAPMILKWGHRRTQDVDCLNDELTDLQKELIAKVGHQNGLSHRWINNAPKHSEPNPENLPPEWEVVFEGENLTLTSPGDRYILAMKLLAARDKDFRDCLLLMNKTGITTKDGLAELFQTAYPYKLVTEQMSDFLDDLAETYEH